MSNSVPRERVGPYRLVKQLGKGGMGAVYEAIQEPIERRVAIKILHGRYAQEPEIAQRFLNEARAVNIVEHPGIVQISDYGQLPSGVAYLVMEYLKGDTLTQRLKKAGGKLPQPEALRIARQIASALAAAHAKNIFHRDLKPDNVMLVVDPDPEAMGRLRVKLLDFGIAKLAAEMDNAGTNTAADVVMGTPKYMSPEQCRGAAAVDDKSDVYALGIMTYEMLAGRPPFLGATGEILAKQIYEDPPPLAELAPWVTQDAVNFVHRLIAKDKGDRPTMRDVTSQLERMTAMFPTMAHPVVMPPPGLSGELSGSAVPAAASTPLQPPIIAPQDPNEKTSTDEDNITNPSHKTPVSPGVAERDSHSGLQKNSTLGFSVGQSSLSLRRSGRFKRLLVGGAALLIVAAAVGTAVVYRDGQVTPTPRGGKSTPTTPTTPATSGTSTTPPPAVKKVFWSLTSIPAGAEITRISDGVVLGKTPRHIEEDAGDEEVPVRLSLPGYQDHVVHLKRSVSDAAEVKLTPLSPEPGSKPTTPAGPRFFRRLLPTRNPPTKQANENKPKLVD
ncbi:MAG TPA: serine/threonine-protein kinase [Pseudomonadota bacterium]|nr:serine/threonine-protein kinase [Pseudomonadota bacterium]